MIYDFIRPLFTPGGTYKGKLGEIIEGNQMVEAHATVPFLANTWHGMLKWNTGMAGLSIFPQGEKIMPRRYVLFVRAMEPSTHSSRNT